MEENLKRTGGARRSSCALTERVKGNNPPAFSRHIKSLVLIFDTNGARNLQSEQLTPVCSVCEAPAPIWTGRRSTAFIIRTSCTVKVEQLTGGHIDGPGIFSQPVAHSAGDRQVDSGDDGDLVGGSSISVRTLLLEQGTKQAGGASSERDIQSMTGSHVPRVHLSRRSFSDLHRCR